MSTPLPSAREQRVAPGHDDVIDVQRVVGVVPTDGGSRVELVVDDELPGSFLGELLDRLYVERRKEREAQPSLDNLKDLVEGRPVG